MRSWKIAATVMAAGLVSACAETPEATAPAESAASLARSSVGSSLVAGQHVFTMHGTSPVGDLSAAIAAAGGTIRYSMDEIGVVLVDGLSDAAAASIARGKATVSNDARGKWIPDLASMSLQLAPAVALGEIDAASLRPPQAAALKQYQWNMRITDTDDAWAQGFTGIPSIRVAIIDTGLDAYHWEFLGLIDMANSIAFVPSKTGPPAWEDDSFHGSHIGAMVTSNNIGIAGVAPNVTLIAVKVLDDKGNGDLGSVIAGIYYAASLGVDVINLSLGATFPKNEVQGLVPAFNRAINYAHSKGVFIATASGNDAEDLQHNGNRITVPCETGVLTCISATGPTDEPAYYTNYGTNAINNAAPGGDFLKSAPGPLGGVLSVCSSRSTDPALAMCAARNVPPFGIVGTSYVFAEGTSVAAPHVAGLGALLDSQFGGTLNGSQIITAIQQNADDLGKPGADPFYGKGRINTCRTLPGCVPVPNP